jgi:hypothetical protein
VAMPAKFSQRMTGFPYCHCCSICVEKILNIVEDEENAVVGEGYRNFWVFNFFFFFCHCLNLYFRDLFS